MVGRKPEITYNKIVHAAKMAHKWGAQVMGLGAFTSVVGDAGVTIAQQSPIPVTTGNTLTVITALETVERALEKLDQKVTHAMVIGATGSIGSACARMLARQEGVSVVLVAPKMEKLVALRDCILQETPDAHILMDTSPDTHAPDCNAIITTTSAFGQRVIDMSTLRPGAVVCDVARPTDVAPEEAALRQDVIVIESGEVLLPPGTVDIGYNIGLPRHVAYACLAETALLAMDHRFESYSLGRSFELEKIVQLRSLYKEHGLQLAPFRQTDGSALTDQDFYRVKSLADDMLQNDERLKELRENTAEALKSIAPSAKGVKTKKTNPQKKNGRRKPTLPDGIHTNCPACRAPVLLPFRRRHNHSQVHPTTANTTANPQHGQTTPTSSSALADATHTQDEEDAILHRMDIGSNSGFCKDCAAEILHV